MRTQILLSTPLSTVNKVPIFECWTVSPQHVCFSTYRSSKVSRVSSAGHQVRSRQCQLINISLSLSVGEFPDNMIILLLMLQSRFEVDRSARHCVLRRLLSFPMSTVNKVCVLSCWRMSRQHYYFASYTSLQVYGVSSTGHRVLSWF